MEIELLEVEHDHLCQNQHTIVRNVSIIPTMLLHARLIVFST